MKYVCFGRSEFVSSRKRSKFEVIRERTVVSDKPMKMACSNQKLQRLLRFCGFLTTWDTCPPKIQKDFAFPHFK